MGFDRDSFRSFAGKVQEKMEEFFPGVLVLDGEQFAVASAGGVLSADHEAGGFVDDLVKMVRLRKELYPDEPDNGVRVLLDGEEGKITAVHDKEWEDSWSLEISLPR